MEHQHQTASDLIRFIGEDRALHNPESIAAAEESLRTRISAVDDASTRRMRRNGMIVAVIGAFTGIWPLLLMPITILIMMPEGAAFKENPLPIVAWLASGCLQAVYGILMARGGIRFRNRSDSGRKLIVRLLWVAIGCTVAFGLAWNSVVLLFANGMERLMVIPGTAMIALFVFLLWLPAKYLSSEAVLKFCSPGYDAVGQR